MLLLAALALLCAGAVYLILLTRQKRAELNGLPQPPVKYWAFGNIPIVAEAMALFPPDAHAHSVFHYMVSAVERNIFKSGKCQEQGIFILLVLVTWSSADLWCSTY
jgi:hypothetical protein